MKAVLAFLMSFISGVVEPPPACTENTDTTCTIERVAEDGA